MTISALDKDTVKLLTTTQIITSVSSAVKELVENALDANAQSIEINLIDNGSTLIEVKDDGCGISKGDAPYMALSSYTSKISSFTDLESLETYGFRGEALSALSTVGDLVVTTKTKDEDAAMTYTIDQHGQIVKMDPCHRAIGTTVHVKQLFRRIPVRRQIITNPKKANQDIKALDTLIKSYGICRFYVRLNYRLDSNIIFAKPSMNSLKEAIIYTLGKKLTSNVSWIEIEDSEINMILMVPSKDVQNVSEVFQTGAQYIFVNNRPVKHKELEKLLTTTIAEALKGDTSSRKKPIFLLHLLLDAANVDVNLEPNKTSIFFKEQQSVLDAVDKHLREYYRIEMNNVQEEEACNESIYYNDYTCETKEDDTEKEQPACKRRKLQLEGNIVDKPVEKEGQMPKKLNKKAVQSSKLNADNSENDAKAGSSGKMETVNRKKDIDDLTNGLALPNLSDSDSNDMEDFTLVYSDNSVISEPTNENEEVKAEDSPPMDFSQSTKIPSMADALNELPVVDLGEDFIYPDLSNKSEVDEKENKRESVNVQRASKDSKFDGKKNATLEAWSKGHVPGLKGGTDVQPYNSASSKVSGDLDSTSGELSRNGNTCRGFVTFSRHITSQVTKENPSLSAPQIAQTITNLWKKLSREERGYYRDLASEEQAERDSRRKQKKEASVVENERNRKRLLGMLDKMRTLQVEKKENLVMRTTIPWDIDLSKVTKSFRVNSAHKSTGHVIGLLSRNLWIVYCSAHIWILDAVRLRKELNAFDTDANEEDAENVERLLKQWLSEKEDLSLLHPIHSLA